MLEEDCLRLKREEAIDRDTALATAEHQRGQRVMNLPPKMCRSGTNRHSNSLTGKVIRGPKTVP